MTSFIYFVHNIHPRLNVHFHVFYIRACHPLEQNAATFLTLTCAYLIFEKSKKQKKKRGRFPIRFAHPRVYLY